MENIFANLDFKILLSILVYLVVADVLLGIIKAIKNKQFSPSQLFDGIEKKIFILIPIGLSFLFDKLVGGGSTVFTNMACIFYISYEGSSLIKNLALMNFPLPSFIKNVFDALGSKESDFSESIVIPSTEEDSTQKSEDTSKEE